MTGARVIGIPLAKRCLATFELRATHLLRCIREVGHEGFHHFDAAEHLTPQEVAQR